jgi:hypothetical protein
MFLFNNSAAREQSQIPGMIEQGFRAIVVFFDVWNIAGLVYANIAEGRQYAQEAISQSLTNGTNSNGNGKIPDHKK